MKLRTCIALAGAILTLLLLLPASAVAAGPWTMKWPSGATAGLIRSSAKTQFGVAGANVFYGRERRLFGSVIPYVTESGTMKGLWRPVITHDRPSEEWQSCGYVKRVNANQYVGMNGDPGSGTTGWRILLLKRTSTGPWRAWGYTDRTHRMYMGRIPRSCPGIYAAGAWQMFRWIAP